MSVEPGISTDIFAKGSRRELEMKRESKTSSSMLSSSKKVDDASITDDVRGAEYYHGLIPRLDAEQVLRREGDFLLRKTEATQGVVVLALSVRISADTVKHFMVNLDPSGTFYFEAHHEKSIPDLINWHLNTKTPLSSASGAKIRRPIERTQWLLNHDSILIVRKLGEGAFGEVFLAEYESGKAKQEVAVKTMRQEATRDARLKFMKEARLMRKYTHKHVVKILGVAVHEHPLMIVMEVCPNGSLLHHLRKNKGKVSSLEKLRFSVEAADGLAYLDRKACIHRDIAARNCLLSAKNEVKISDFGMSDDRVIVHDDTLDKVPVKWLAPETLQEKIYSLKTDVWAFGVLVWEIYADGADPYPGLTNVQTRAKIVVQDYRMKMPEGTPKFVSEVVANCWERDASKRNDMNKISKTLLEYYNKEKK
ncbi:unnamed protein product [Caenorhabditis auriculariae]|uniref:Tyrosine-protein kinase n=1 Tax=Caenorhabditis auriculariae TaxID=2777116 RepID=A0A8S1GX15_9PELO|nr:unnamed protein product [Caenorhabditis auriculariae]